MLCKQKLISLDGCNDNTVTNTRRRRRKRKTNRGEKKKATGKPLATMKRRHIKDKE